MGGLEGGIERDSMKNLKKMGGRRGVGNPVCPPEGPRSGRRSLWANVGLSMPLSRWGRESPHVHEVDTDKEKARNVGTDSGFKVSSQGGRLNGIIVA